MGRFLNKKNKNIKGKTFYKKLGITFVSIFGILLINLVFNIFTLFNSFLLGTFGLLTYAMFISFIILGVLLILNKNVYINSKDIVFLCLWLLLFILILQIATTSSYIDSTYGYYLNACYNNKITAGGLLIGLFAYPISFICSHTVATYIILLILLTITSSIIIDRFILSKKAQKTDIISESNKNKEEIKENLEYTNQNTNDENDIFIKDSSKDDEIFNAQEDEEKERAKKLLGLKEEVALNENDINTFYDENIKNESNNFTQNNNFVKDNYNSTTKPNMFVHTNDEYEEKNIPQKKIEEVKTKIDPNLQKNQEFLKATSGAFTPKKNRKGITNFVVDQNEEVIDNIEKPLNINKNNIYDEELTLKKFDETPNKFDKFINEIDNNTSKTEDDDFEYVNSSTNKDVVNLRDTYYSGQVKDNIVESTSSGQYKINLNEVKNNTSPRPKNRKKQAYVYPTLDLLDDYLPPDDNLSNAEVMEKGNALEETLESFGIPAKISSFTIGPTFTRFELKMPQGISVKKVQSLAEDIRMTLATEGGIRMEIPIPGKNAFGIEIPNKTRTTVGLKDVLDSYNFQKKQSPLTFALGKDISGECVVADIEKTIHTLIAGTTGSGKSICLNALLISLMYKSTPDDFRLILIDPKRVEFTLFNNLPHLLIPNVITDAEKVVMALDWCVNEMENRFIKFSNAKVKDINEYNKTAEVVSGFTEKLPFILIVVDELSDLMSRNKKEIEEKIVRLAQKSRAAGLYLILCTQRPSTDVITGLIKANLNSRITFAVKSFIDSKTILDETGAENLLGKGDMLMILNGMSESRRLQGAFISTKEVDKVVTFIKENNECDYDENIEEEMFNPKSNEFEINPNKTDEFDALMKDALRSVIKMNSASTTKLQRIFGIGYPRAAKLIDQMVAGGFISEPDNKNNRAIFITQQEFEERFGEDL